MLVPYGNFESASTDNTLGVPINIMLSHAVIIDLSTVRLLNQPLFGLIFSASNTQSVETEKKKKRRGSRHKKTQHKNNKMTDKIYYKKSRSYNINQPKRGF